MEKPQTTRHWREVHRSRRQSTGSLNQSFNSNRSSLSSGYNRFHFHRHQEEPAKPSIFHFHPRNRDNPHEVSLLSKEPKSRTPRPPKVMTEEALPNLQNILRKMPTFGQGQATSREGKLTNLVKDLQKTIKILRSALAFFEKEIRKMRQDWDTAFQQLQVQIESQTVICPLTVQSEQKLWGEGQNGVGREESPLKRLGISKVEEVRGHETSLSRNNTLQSLLAEGGKCQSGFSWSHIQLRPAKQINSLQQRLLKMRQLLDSPS